MSDLKSINRDTLLADNRTDGERALEQATKRLVSSENFFDWLVSPKKTKPHLLGNMAIEAGVIDWYEADEDQYKRKAIEASPFIMQKAGTLLGIKEGMAAIGFGVDIVRNPNGRKYELGVTAWRENTPITQALIDRAMDRLNNIKSARDSIDIAMAYAASTSIVIAAAAPVLNSVTTTDATASLWDMPPCIGSIQASAAHVPVTSVATISSNAVINSPEIHAEIGLRQSASELAISVTEIKATASNDMEVKEFSESSGYKVTIMEQGLAELISAKSKGVKGEIAEVAFGTESYNPAHNQTQLRQEVDRVDIGQYIDTGGSSLKMVTKTDNTKEYPVREIGFFLSSGTLLGVISAPGEILNYKTKKTALIQIFVLNLAALPTESITVVVGIENLNILIDEQMMSDAVAFARSQKSQTQHLFAYMKLAEKVHKMETENE